jgi:glycosyltransferase involved in cell wall biosynthesis
MQALLKFCEHENLKVAIVADWLVVVGGAERFLSSLIECFPHADLFAVIDFLDPEDRKKVLGDRPVKTTFIQKLPFARKKYRTYLPLMPLAIEQLDLTGYDVVISSSHAVAKGVITGPDQIHVAYIHSPMRYAWDLQGQYLKESNLISGPKSWVARYLLHKMRAWDVLSSSRVDYFLSNSDFVGRRILKFYRRESTTIHPGVDLSEFALKSLSIKKEEFYLTASRMVPYKKMDLIVETFSQYFPDKKLIVIGDGPDFEKIKRVAGENVSLIGRQSQENLIDYLQRAKAFIFAAEEDFGLLPVEAQACGTPVIAYGKGGACETIWGLGGENPPSGLFFDEQTPQKLKEAIDFFEQNSEIFKPENCRKNSGNCY